MAKGEIDHDGRFLLLTQSFNLMKILQIKVSFDIYFPGCIQSPLLQICCILERIEKTCDSRGKRNDSLQATPLQKHFQRTLAAGILGPILHNTTNPQVIAMS